MRKLFLSILIFIGFAIHMNAQHLQLTSNAQISVITVAPGNELVDSFGHSAFRVRDSYLSVDIVYNYGTYNFNTPNFYGKFAQGKLLYDLGVSRFDNFLQHYAAQNRTVVEQILNLTKEEKQQFFEFLQTNARSENKSYLYDFFFDNCATKLRDVSNEILTENIQFNYIYDEMNLTFRDLIHKYLDDQAWGKFGIDLALGSVIDRKATPEEYSFLPDYIYKNFEKGIINNKPLVRITRTLFSSKPTKKKQTYLTPFLLFSLLTILVIWISYRDYKKSNRTKWLDFLLFFFTGVVGLVVLLLWFATDHSATQGNYNILWAFAPNLVVGFLMLHKELKPWLKKYILLLLILIATTCIIWILKIQIFSIVLIPILIMLGVRYTFLFKKFKQLHPVSQTQNSEKYIQVLSLLVLKQCHVYFFLLK